MTVHSKMPAVCWMRSVLLDFLLLSCFGRRSVAVWMCADMLTVLLHQLFGKEEVKATPASCFQRGVLCVCPQATIKACREPRFNHMHPSCPTETLCSKAETLSYQKSSPKLRCLITKAWGSVWPDDDPFIILHYACSVDFHHASHCSKRISM